MYDGRTHVNWTVRLNPRKMRSQLKVAETFSVLEMGGGVITNREKKTYKKTAQPIR